eukprot:6469669-Amphidinium_carterae.1
MNTASPGRALSGGTHGITQQSQQKKCEGVQRPTLPEQHSRNHDNSESFELQCVASMQHDRSNEVLAQKRSEVSFQCKPGSSQ